MTGNAFGAALEGAGFTLTLFLRAALWLRAFGSRWREIRRQVAQCAFGGLPVSFIVAVFSGMILSLQTGIELKKFGQEETVGFVVAASMCREMGPVFTAIILAGLIGSTMAAELGTMAVSEEIDALTVMSIDPVRFLVMPRLVSLALVCPLLTIYVDVVGILGGGVVSHAVLGVDIQVYGRNAWDVLEMKDVYGGLLKSLLFGCLIATIGCSQGLRARNGAEGVGRNTMRSVVNSLIFILMFDYFLTWALY